MHLAFIKKVKFFSEFTTLRVLLKANYWKKTEESWVTCWSHWRIGFFSLQCIQNPVICFRWISLKSLLILWKVTYCKLINQSFFFYRTLYPTSQYSPNLNRHFLSFSYHFLIIISYNERLIFLIKMDFETKMVVLYLRITKLFGKALTWIFLNVKANIPIFWFCYMHSSHKTSIEVWQKPCQRNHSTFWRYRKGKYCFYLTLRVSKDFIFLKSFLLSYIQMTWNFTVTKTELFSH